MRTGNNIYKRSNGYWEGRYKDGYNSNGKTKYKSVYAKTYIECKEKLESAKKQIAIPIDKRSLKVNDLYILYVLDSQKFYLDNKS